MNTALKRITIVTAAYDCIRNPCKFGSDRCKPNTGGSHGIHNSELRMIVQGPTAEVLLNISTGWQLSTVPASSRNILEYPNGNYVEFHTAAPMYEGQEMSPRVEVADEAICKSWDCCYSDRGWTMADYPTTLLVAEGSEPVWKWLETTHDDAVLKMSMFGN